MMNLQAKTQSPPLNPFTNFKRFFYSFFSYVKTADDNEIQTLNIYSAVLITIIKT